MRAEQEEAKQEKSKHIESQTVFPNSWLQ